MRFAKKVALVTGGASGIGKATAMALAGDGALSVIVDRNEEAAESAAAEIGVAGGSAAVIRCDVTHEDEIRSAVVTAIDKFGSIDILVNNAGVAIPNDFQSTSVELPDWTLAFDVHVRAPLLFAQAIIPHMRERRSGTIVNVASIGAFYGTGGGHAYRSSKAALVCLTRTLAIELAAYGVRVNCICPGSVRTPLRESATALEHPITQASAIPLGRIADPEEIAGPIAFLASDEASFITGATLIVDGGQLAA